MFTGPVRPVEVFFYWPEAVFLEFLLAWGHRFTLSVEPCTGPLSQRGSPLSNSSNTSRQGLTQDPSYLSFGQVVS